MRVDQSTNIILEPVVQESDSCSYFDELVQKIWDLCLSCFSCCSVSDGTQIEASSSMFSQELSHLSQLQQNVHGVMDATRANIEQQYAANYEFLVQQRDHAIAQRDYLIDIKEKLAERISEAEATKNNLANAIHRATQSDASAREERLEALRNRMSNNTQPIG